jgi:D-glycero-D-manno-heptose 1,7-bisphosphate phosphatase
VTAAWQSPAQAAAVFVDKDGTLVEDVPYNADPARVKFMPNALAGLRRMADAGLLLMIVTNQPGIAIGRIQRRDFASMQRAIERRLRDEAGVELAGWYVCPHAPALPPDCTCRKPAAGLIRQAAAEHGVDLTRSWMVGDILDDVEAGRRAGCRTVLLDVGNETVWHMSPLREPHHRCSDLLQAAEVIVTHTTPAGALGGPL